MKFDVSEIVKVDITFNTSPKHKKPDARNALKIGNISFAEYTAKRLVKDGLGFLPVKAVEESATDCKTYIRAPIPMNSLDFLGYAHELGHCKSKQPDQQYGMFGSNYWCKGRIECEYNAWIWALKYFRRLGFTLHDVHISSIKRFFGSYLDNASDLTHAKNIAEQFDRITGIRCEVKEQGHFMSSPMSFSVGGHWFDECSKFTVKKEKPLQEKHSKEKPKNWKPWHDLKQGQLKKQWRNLK